MKLKTLDDSDSKFVKVMSQEFIKCQLAYNQFNYLRRLAVLQNKCDDKLHSIVTYNSYVLFIQHLYEFYLV